MLWKCSLSSSCSLEKASKACERDSCHGIHNVMGQKRALRVSLFKSLSRFPVEASCWRWCSGNTSDIVWDERVLQPSITRNSRMTKGFRQTRFWQGSVRTCLNCLDFSATHRFLTFSEQTRNKASGVGIRCQLLTFTLHQMLHNASKRLIYRWRGKKPLVNVAE